MDLGWEMPGAHRTNGECRVKGVGAEDLGSWEVAAVVCFTGLRGCWVEGRL